MYPRALWIIELYVYTIDEMLYAFSGCSFIIGENV